MGQPQYPSPASERWSINLPLLIGVVFVFLVGAVIWVIAATGGDDDPDSIETSSSTSSSTSSTTLADTTTTTTSTTVVPGTTTPAPMPDPIAVTTTVAVTVPVSSAPATTQPPPATTAAPATTQPPPATTAAPTTQPAPPTTAEGADPGTVPGDLGIPGFPMQAPPCNDSYITVLASAVGADVAAGVERLLDEYPTSNYLRTDQTCPSLTQDIDGEPIYVVFFGPFAFVEDACAARSEGTEDAYARILSESERPDHIVDCPA